MDFKLKWNLGAIFRLYSHIKELLKSFFQN